MSTPYICQFCGKPTDEVETDHLPCILSFEHEQRKVNFPDRRLLLVGVQLIKNTPNDQELGAKVRELYYDAYNNG